jgi:hypothetical protein
VRDANGQIASVPTSVGPHAKNIIPSASSGQLTLRDVEISEEMFIITKETAEAYRKDAARPGGATQPNSRLKQAIVVPPRGRRPIRQRRQRRPDRGRTGPQTPEQKSELTWSGGVPSQIWINFYTKVLTKLGVSSGLTLTVKIQCKPEGGLSTQKLDELRSALRELGLSDQVDSDRH